MKRLILLFVVIQVFYNVKCQTDSITQYDISDTLKSNFGLFRNDSILEIDLRFDITEYKRVKPKDEYMKALLTYHLNGKDSITKEIKLKSRGEFRNSYCSFPPIRLNFKKADFEDPEFDKLEKVKMVTHCNSGNETYLFKEYLIYKIYNVLTDYSFRVRLLKVNYINTRKESKVVNTYAFIIEPEEFLTERIGGRPVERQNLSLADMKQEAADRMAIFNYMIGNTDWAVPNLHNVKIYSIPFSENPGLGMVIPYDFDYSGLVNASYAVPHEDLPIQSVQQRYYMGVCRTEQEYLNALKVFSDKKDKIYETILKFPYLSERVKKDMIKYLNEFYVQFDKRNTIVYSLLKDCKQKITK